jgi:hypothetical protein
MRYAISLEIVPTKTHNKFFKSTGFGTYAFIVNLVSTLTILEDFLNTKGGHATMLFFDRRKNKDRRAQKDHRVLNNSQYTEPENRSETERRSDKDRRGRSDRRTGMYHKLPEFRKNTLDGILNRLEDLLEEER